MTGINNTYSGGTTISGGTLQVGYGGIGLLGPEPVTDNAALVYDLLANATFNGVISGSGSLARMESGIPVSHSVEHVQRRGDHFQRQRKHHRQRFIGQRPGSR